MPPSSPTSSDDPAREYFDALWRTHYPLVLAYATRRIPESARDVASEVFLVAWRRLDAVPVDAGPWLLGVARKVIANHLRESGRRRSLAERLRSRAAPPGGDPGDSVEDGGLRRAFGSLSAGDRELLALIAWEGLTPAQAAVALGVTRPTLAVRLHRARRRLAHALDEADREAGRRNEPDKPEGQTA